MSIIQTTLAPDIDLSLVFFKCLRLFFLELWLAESTREITFAIGVDVVCLFQCSGMGLKEEVNWPVLLDVLL